jgi:flagellin
MAVIINTNVSAIAAQNSLRTSSLNQNTAMERLSSGMRINNAKDDAAGLAISTRMTASIRGMDAAVRNANDGISATQTAEGSLAAIQDNLQRMRELAVQAANDTNGTSDRTSLDNESKALIAEIDRVVGVTSFNGNALIDGNFKDKKIQVGSSNSANDVIKLTIGNASTGATGLVVSAVDLTDQAKATTALGLLDTALDKVTTMRSAMGAFQNQFNAAITNLQNTTMNLQASRSRILDTDYAKETTNLAKAQIIQQAATAMLAQANQSSQSVLALLK